MMRTRIDQVSMGREQGMTTAELVIVLAITGALSLFMGTELQAMADRVYLDAAVAEVVGDLRRDDRRSLQPGVQARRPSRDAHRRADRRRPRPVLRPHEGARRSA